MVTQGAIHVYSPKEKECRYLCHLHWDSVAKLQSAVSENKDVLYFVTQDYEATVTQNLNLKIELKHLPMHSNSEMQC